MCTFSGMSVRIVQAHLRDQQLCMSFTEWIDMEEENHDKAILVLGWMLSRTCGNTQSDTASSRGRTVD
jgi:hypothetical protein